MLRSVESSGSKNQGAIYAQTKSKSKQSFNQNDNKLKASKKISLGLNDFPLKNHVEKMYPKPKQNKNFIAANKEKVKGGLLDYARSIKDSPMVMVDKLNSRMIKDLDS